MAEEPNDAARAERDDADEKRDDEKPREDDIRRDDEIVDEASEDSFPGSDPPSYTGTTAGESDEQRED